MCTVLLSIKSKELVLVHDGTEWILSIYWREKWQIRKIVHFQSREWQNMLYTPCTLGASAIHN
jgi:hypothetical protein